jgi:lipopolysaccharide transport system ATP-binding protein
MSSDAPVIVADGLSKSYRISHQERHTTIREAMLARVRRGRSNADETFWALQDVSFRIGRGEVVGVVGRNGAGKSTLLKVLSRITEPTRGEARIWGSVGSLLEVGTGFHGELTGRENIFLNGAILGMRRQDVARQFDAIVEFADVARFLDTPVKRYSSGMYVRLAFAVAAHLNPDVLIVDEVLAVGDAAFQAKCLGRMREVAHEDGRTVLFVSHNMAAVNAMCTRGLYMEGGRLVLDGDVPEVVARYNASVSNVDGPVDLRSAQRRGGKRARLSSVALTPIGPDGETLSAGAAGCDWRIEVGFDASEDVSNVLVDVIVYDPNGYRLIDVNSAKAGQPLALRGGEHAHLTFVVQDARLKPGTYPVGLWLGTAAETLDYVDPAASFTVLTYEDGQRHEHYPGPYIPRFTLVSHVSGPPTRVDEPNAVEVLR